jgi:hypothetical protein
MVVLLEGFHNLHRGALTVTIGFLVTSLPSLPIAQFNCVVPNVRGSKRLPFKNDGGHCVLGDIQCCRKFLVPFPRSVLLHNPLSVLY